MKKLVILAATLPCTALAHPGHPELAGSAGHDLAHLALGGGIAALAVAGLVLLRRFDTRRQEE